MGPPVLTYVSMYFACYIFLLPNGQTKCNDAILDCCSLLGEPRHCLGIVASSRGYLAGRISIRGEVSTGCPPRRKRGYSGGEAKSHATVVGFAPRGPRSTPRLAYS